MAVWAHGPTGLCARVASICGSPMFQGGKSGKSAEANGGGERGLGERLAEFRFNPSIQMVVSL